MWSGSITIGSLVVYWICKLQISIDLRNLLQCLNFLNSVWDWALSQLKRLLMLNSSQWNLWSYIVTILKFILTCLQTHWQLSGPKEYGKHKNPSESSTGAIFRKVTLLSGLTELFRYVSSILLYLLHIIGVWLTRHRLENLASSTFEPEYHENSVNLLYNSTRQGYNGFHKGSIPYFSKSGSGDKWRIEKQRNCEDYSTISWYTV